MRGQSKEIALIGLLAAVYTALAFVVPVVSLFVFIVFSLSFKLAQTVSLGAVVAAIGWVSTGRVLSLLNIVMLPAIAFGIYEFKARCLSARSQCVSAATRKDKVNLGAITYVVVFAANVLSEVAASVVFGLGFAYVIASLPVAIIGAGVTALLTGAFGLYLSAVVTKLLRHLEPAP